MKTLFILLLLFSLPAFSQKATFKEIKLYANPKYFNPEEKYATIIFPIVATKDRIVSATINDQIKEELFSLEKREDVTSEIKNQINTGLTDISYEVTYNKNYILSLNIYTEGSGGNHIAFDNVYFNFDLRNGKEIVLSDLIRKEKIDSFKSKVFQDRNDSLEKYKREKFALIQDKVIDSSDYQWITEKLNEENIMDEGFGERFVLSDEGIEIIEPMVFPSVIRSQEPTFHLRYSFKELRPIMCPKFLKSVIK